VAEKQKRKSNIKCWTLVIDEDPLVENLKFIRKNEFNNLINIYIYRNDLQGKFFIPRKRNPIQSYLWEKPASIAGKSYVEKVAVVACHAIVSPGSSSNVYVLD